jgi:hypothetical protein
MATYAYNLGLNCAHCKSQVSNYQTLSYHYTEVFPVIDYKVHYVIVYFKELYKYKNCCNN